MSCFKAFGPPIENHAAGQTVLDEFLICFEDGRLVERWLQKVTYPCSCSPETTCMYTFCVIACGGQSQTFFIPGSTVTVSYGSVQISSGVTGDNGCVTLCIGPFATYTVTATNQYGTVSYTIPLLPGQSTQISMGDPPPGYVCCAGCVVPITLFLTDGFTTVALHNISGSNRWAGCYIRPIDGYGYCQQFEPCDGNLGGTSMAVIYLLICGATAGSFSMFRTNRSSSCGNGMPIPNDYTTFFFCGDAGINMNPPYDINYCGIISAPCDVGPPPHPPTNCGGQLLDNGVGVISSCDPFVLSIEMALECSGAPTPHNNQICSPSSVEVMISA